MPINLGSNVTGETSVYSQIKRDMVEGQLPSGGGGFTPNSISNCFLWYDFSDTATYTPVAGVITSIQDKSPSGNTGTGSVAIDSSGGTFSLNCAKSPYDLGLASSFESAGKTIFAAAYTDFNGVSGGFGAMILLNDNTDISSTGHGIEIITSGSNTRMQVYDGTFGAYSPLGSVTVAKHVFTYTLGNPASSFVFRQDLAVQTTNLIVDGSFSLVCNRVGAYAANPTYGQGLNARLAELIVYNRILTGTEIGQVESYLKTKWGTP